MSKNFKLSKEMINESNIFTKEQLEEFWEFIKENGEKIEQKDADESKQFLLGSITCNKVLLFIGACFISSGLSTVVGLSQGIYPLLGLIVNIITFSGLAQGGYQIYENIEFKQAGTVLFELSSIALIFCFAALDITIQSSIYIGILAFFAGSIQTYFLIQQFNNIEFNVLTIIMQLVLILLIFNQLSNQIELNYNQLSYVQIAYCLAEIFFVQTWDLKLGRQVDVVTLQYLMASIILQVYSFYLEPQGQVVLAIIIMILTLILFKFVFMIVGVVAMISAILRILNNLGLLNVLNSGIVILLFGLFLIVFGYFYNAYNVSGQIQENAAKQNIESQLPEDEYVKSNEYQKGSDV